jgi:hypothetical protein
MKFKQIILRPTALLAAFAGSVSAVSLFSVRPDFECTAPVVKETRPVSNISFISGDDYAVFSAVLERIGSAETIVIGDQAIDPNWKDAPYIKRQDNNLSEYTVKDYQLKNREFRQISNKFTISSEVVLLSREEESRLFPKGEAGWEKFYRKYPKARGIIYFSSPGFNEKKDEALVRATFQSGFWGSSENFYFLKKLDGKWHVRKESYGLIIFSE